MSSSTSTLPASFRPPDAPLPFFRLLRTAVRNPIEVWPRAAYEQPIVKIRRGRRHIVLVMDPEMIGEMLVDKADAFVKSSSMRRALQPALGEALLTGDGAHWRRQRRAVAPIFRPDRVRGFVDAMIAAAGATRDRWLAQEGLEVDIAHEMMRTTFDVIVAAMLSGVEGIDVARVARDITTYLDSTGWTIALSLISAPLWMPYPGRRKAMRARDYLRGELMRIVEERRRSDHQPNDLVTRLLEARDPESGQAMSDRDIADNLITFIAAGHETTALALSWAFYLLCLYPQAEARIVEEVETVTGGAPLAEAHLDKLVFTRQVLKEAMRLYPPAPIIARDAARDIELGGEPIAAGSPTYVPVYILHRHALLWDEPDEFEPERFEAAAEKARHRFAYLPFGAGPRICIGMSFATTEGVAILATLIRHVRLSLRPGFVPTIRMRITLRPGAGMPMRLAGRRTVNPGARSWSMSGLDDPF
jgi:cytochrome P450